MDLRNKRVLVTGATGMIGRELVGLLVEKGADVYTVSMEPEMLWGVHDHWCLDLTEKANCRKIVAISSAQVVFHVAGIKGSPKMCWQKPASFSVPMLQFNTNMMEAAMKVGVEWYLYTSSIGVYHPEPLLREDRVWETFPSENDKFAGWAKRMGELQVEAYAIEFGKRNISIVRPANVYGPNDNFDPASAMVIPSLIAKCAAFETVEVWGDGSQVRDFIHAHDVARAMVFAVENEITDPLNVGSGPGGTTIREVAETIAAQFSPARKLLWDPSKPTGDQVRMLDSSRLRKLGFENTVSLADGLKSTIQWYLTHKDETNKRHNPFK